ncbi:hypothetical protein [Vibrio sp. 10N.261.55.A7]|uniref:hypothetical protein n=1 Tax=Vibrio sp. 10N.261.55.A7 TaxID=1880851 RepID=UPI000C83117D|nr:hypothetical protein [Vibrio sp. 10N.261.55.A7]PMJ97872.1 hypothetical protein BCU12_22020 [Vibrio sp. 10N.261.55.A7]
MSLNCPDCKAPLNAKELFLNSITTCKVCEKNCCMGNLIQYLTIALVGLISLFGLLFISTTFEKSVQLFLSLGGSLICISITGLIVLRPVKYFGDSAKVIKKH